VPEYGVGKFGYTSQYDHFGAFEKAKLTDGDSLESKRESVKEQQTQSVISGQQKRVMTAPQSVSHVRK